MHINPPLPSLGARHRVSGLNSSFVAGTSGFGSYIERCRAMIAQTRDGADPELLNQIVEGNAPFELKPSSGFYAGVHKPYRRGILLTHGLTDSPYSMRYLAAFFQEQGFRVMAILLPGHGTQPGDLLEVTWQEWAKALEYGVDQLAAEVEELYLGGLSAGAALSVFQSQYDDRVRGLFLFSPAFEISPRAAYASLHKFYSWLVASAKWVDVLPDIDIYKYESFPKNGATQIHKLIRAIGKARSGTTLPVFVAASSDDLTVNCRSTLEFFSGSVHPVRKLVLYTSDTQSALADISSGILPGIPKDKLELVNSAFPESGILSSAHTAITLPPDDLHYGVNGEYSNCNHYFRLDMERYSACMGNPASALQGEVTEQNLQAGLLRRLMYNPNFNLLKVSLGRFVEGLP